jgi:all-trans-retinol 13,14-reductase
LFGPLFFIATAFSKKLIREQNWDAIVIGSGPGGKKGNFSLWFPKNILSINRHLGLSSAALLSKAGLKVLVLEKHDTCGGGCHTFKEEGYEFDVGIHFVGGFTRQTLTHTLFDQISDGQIQWAQLGKDIDQ